MSPGVKERLEVVYDIAKTTFHWGFIPMVLYLGKSLLQRRNHAVLLLCSHFCWSLLI